MSDNNTRIRRAKHGKENPYFMMLRDTAQDLDLSAEALGILTYILSKPNDWETKIGDLQKRKGVGRDRARRIVNELIEARYMKREKIRKPSGTFDYVIDVYEEPHDHSLETVDGNPVTGFPSTENTTLHNKEEDITEDVVVEDLPERPPIFKVWESEVGTLTPTLIGLLKCAVEDYPDGWVHDAIIEARMSSNRVTWKYVEAILKRWKADGRNKPKQPAQANGNGANTNSKRYEIDVNEMDLGLGELS